MSKDRSPAGAPTLPVSEVLELARGPVALFSEDAKLQVANSAFRAGFASVGAFLDPGTSWALFIGEVERHQILPRSVCDGLRLLEERLIWQDAAPPAMEGLLAGNEMVAVRLVATSDGGFAMTLRPTVDTQELDDSERVVEALMSKVLAACPAPLTMARIGDGQILYRSPAATELLGKGMNSLDHFALRSERADFITALLPDARVDDMRLTGRGPDGRSFPAAISARLIDYRGEDVVVSTTVDLTDELALQDELARQKEQVFQAEKMSALGELLAGVAHELNNPLSIVVGNALLLREDDLEPAVHRRVEKLSDAAERCVRIVRTFLSMARDRPMQIAPVPVVEIVDMAVEAFEAGEGSEAVTVTIALEDGLPPVAADEVQLVQVLTNLLTNAEHAMTEAGVGDEVRITGGANQNGLRLIVTDNGPGVPAEIAGRIFDPLFTTKSAGKGTGVGLALCHRIMEAHGGAISLETDRSGGARFVLELPLAE